MSKQPTPTVLDLIHALQTLVHSRPESAAMDVVMEGCDCNGTWLGGIEVETYKGQGVELKRSRP